MIGFMSGIQSCKLGYNLQVWNTLTRLQSGKDEDADTARDLLDQCALNVAGQVNLDMCGAA
jgi:hypothetical protein